MIEPKIYIAKATMNSDGSVTTQPEVEIQDYFKGAYYNLVDGLEAYGQPRTYTETFPEDEVTDVLFGNSWEPTDFTLKLYFFDPESSTDDAVALQNIDAAYHAFVNYITGSYIKFWDNIRKRKVLLAFTNSVKPDVDHLYGLVYKSVAFKFKNIYGRTFGINEDTGW